MKRAALHLGVLALVPAMAFAQSNGAPPKDATDITSAEVNAVLTSKVGGTDRQLKVVDVGKLNVAVGVIHRGPTRDSPDGAVRAIAHHQETETYIILSGSGTLVTGGTIVDPKDSAKDSDITKVLNGPSVSGTVQGATSRVVNPGDVIIIPPDVPHGWTKITDHVDYLSVRPDPDHILPAGYVNPVIKK